MRTVMMVGAALLVAMASTASAGEWGQRGDSVKVKSVANSYSQSQSSSNSSINQRDRLQAPGFGVGGGYCSNGLSIAFPGGGFGFSAMERACKVEVYARVAKTNLGNPAAAQYVCQQAEFRNLTVCRGGRR